MAQHHGLAKFNDLEQFCAYHREPVPPNRFGRLFPDLAPHYLDPEILRKIGAPGGPMDGGAKADRTDSVSVGMAFFGQFIDHDITLDVTSSLTEVNAPRTIENVRTPTLDLDSVFGDGPEAHAFLYVQEGEFAGVKLLTGADGTAADQPKALADQDLARSSAGRAIIGDPRNDENGIISQMHLQIIRFYNAVAEKVRAAEKLEGHALYERARQVATHHYQWTIVNDFLPAMCGQAVIDRILCEGRKVYPDCGSPFIPVEFAVAAYRYGHSMMPQKIQLQKGGSSFELFGTVIGRGFSPLADAKAVPDWDELFFTSQNRGVQTAEKLDSKLAKDLLALLFIPSDDERSLATRNLLRGQSFLLPAGEKIAAACERDESEIEAVVKSAEKLSDGLITGCVPLWYYLLVEAETIGRETRYGSFDKSEGLGPVGATLVAETLIGLLELDSRSYLSTNRSWRPDPALVGIQTVGEMMTFH